MTPGPRKPFRHHRAKPRPPELSPMKPAPVRNPATAPISSSPATDWGPVAQWYDQLVGEAGSEYHREVVLPGALRLLGASAGQKVLDIACGQGVLCRMLAGRGIQTTGVDAASDLVNLARERNTSLPAGLPVPKYMVGDVRHLKFLPLGAFDSAACVLSLQNMHPIGGVCRGVAGLLAPMGRFVIVLMHPCFRVPKETHWGWDEAKKVQFRRVDRYLLPRKVPIVTHPGMSLQYTWSFHKPIESYVKALRQAGLLVDTIEEWPSHKTSTSGPRAPAENTARKEIPMFMAIRAIKAGVAEAVGEAEADGG